MFMEPMKISNAGNETEFLFCFDKSSKTLVIDCKGEKIDHSRVSAHFCRKYGVNPVNLLYFANNNEGQWELYQFMAFYNNKCPVYKKEPASWDDFSFLL